MKQPLSRRFRYWLIAFVAGKPSAYKSFALRSCMMLALMVMFVPMRVSREVVHGAGNETPDLKTALRCVLWLWNRSWMPFKRPVGTFFDIGWVLSEASCQALLRRSFLNKDPLKRQVDVAQLGLSSIKAGVEAQDHDKIQRADDEISARVMKVFDAGRDWSDTTAHSIDSPQSTAAPEYSDSDGTDKGFHNATTRAALLAFDDLCARIGQEYFLVSGTFLGVVRDGTFIGHDHDIDLGIYASALHEDFLEALRASNDFTVARVDHIHLRESGAAGIRYARMDTPALIRIFHQSGIGLDVFVHFRDGAVDWHGCHEQRWDNTAFDLADYEFLGRTFKGPADADRYLTENYGPDWRVPKVDFDSSVDTPNISFVGSANGLVFWAWMVAQAVAEQDKRRVRKYLELLTRLGVYQPNDSPQPTVPDGH